MKTLQDNKYGGKVENLERIPHKKENVVSYVEKHTGGHRKVLPMEKQIHLSNLSQFEGMSLRG